MTENATTSVTTAERPANAAMLDGLRAALATAFATPEPSTAFDASLHKIRAASAMAFALRTAMITALIGGFAAVAVWACDRTPPVVTLESTLESPVPAGGRLRQTVRAYRLKTCHVLVERTVYDSRNTRFSLADEDTEVFGEEGEAPPYSQLIPIDPDAAAGPAWLHTVLTWRCNPLQRLFPITVRRPPRAFVITRGPDHGG